MSLREELPNKTNPVVFSKINQAAHDELSRQVDDFIAKGGVINPVAMGASAYTQPKSNKPQVQSLNEPIRESTLYPNGKNNSSIRSKFGQNIFERGRIDKRNYVVVIAAETFGSGEGWTQQQAIEQRDKIRAKRGMRPAEY